MIRVSFGLCPVAVRLVSFIFKHFWFFSFSVVFFVFAWRSFQMRFHTTFPLESHFISTLTISEVSAALCHNFSSPWTSLIVTILTTFHTFLFWSIKNFFPVVFFCSPNPNQLTSNSFCKVITYLKSAFTFTTLKVHHSSCFLFNSLFVMLISETEVALKKW